MQTAPPLSLLSRVACLAGGLACFSVGLAAVVIARSDGVPIALRFACVPAAFGAGWLGYLAMRAGRRGFKAAAGETVPESGKPRVVYLRSFTDDAVAAGPAGPTQQGVPIIVSEEEAVLGVFKPLGEVIAIGRPGEPMPELGAVRFYVRDSEWQQAILREIARAELVVLRFGFTAGLKWELAQCIRLLRPQQLVVLVLRGIEKSTLLPDLLEELTGQPAPPLPEPPWRVGAFGDSSLAGYLTFEDGWVARPHRLQFGSFGGWMSSIFRLDMWNPWLSKLAVAFKPVYKNLGRPWMPPPAKWARNCLSALVFVAVLGVAAFFVAITWEPASMRESRERREQEKRQMDEMFKKIQDTNEKFRRDQEQWDRRWKEMEDQRRKAAEAQERLKRLQEMFKR